MVLVPKEALQSGHLLINRCPDWCVLLETIKDF